MRLEEESVRWLAANLEPLKQAVDNVFRTQDLESWRRSGEPLLDEGRVQLGVSSKTKTIDRGRTGHVQFCPFDMSWML